MITAVYVFKVNALIIAFKIKIFYLEFQNICSTFLLKYNIYNICVYFKIKYNLAILNI